MSHLISFYLGGVVMFTLSLMTPNNQKHAIGLAQVLAVVFWPFMSVALVIAGLDRSK